jgi:hypothetical protein
MLRVGVCCFLAAIVVAGCGGGTSQLTPREVAQAYVDALNHRDAAKACALLTDDYRRQLAHFYSSCESFYDKDPDPFRRLRYGLFLHTVQVHGDHATAEMATRRGPETTYSVQLARVDGEWRLTGQGV